MIPPSTHYYSIAGKYDLDPNPRVELMVMVQHTPSKAEDESASVFIHLPMERPLDGV